MKKPKTADMNVKYVLGGLDARIFDRRPFPFSVEAMERLCGVYRIGKPEHLIPEWNIRISHSNFIVYVKTPRGTFLLKCYARERPEFFLRELSVNRFLIRNRFSVPAMLTAGRQNPYVRLEDHYVTCYEWIDAQPLYSFPLDGRLLSGVADVMVGMRRLLADFSHLRPAAAEIFEPFDQRMTTLHVAMARFGAWKHSGLIVRILDKLDGFYRRRCSLFTPSLLHTNLGLSNILMKDGRYFVVDLTHVQGDYHQQDLASFCFSCYLFDVPLARIETFARTFIRTQADPRRQEALWKVLFVKLAVQKLEKTLDKEIKALSLRRDSALLRSYLYHIRRRKTQLLSVIGLFGKDLP